VYCDFFGIYILFLNFLRHQTMDKVQKYNSFNEICSLHKLRIQINARVPTTNDRGYQIRDWLIPLFNKKEFIIIIKKPVTLNRMAVC
jgi:hypothetical protein